MPTLPLAVVALTVALVGCTKSDPPVAAPGIACDRMGIVKRGEALLAQRDNRAALQESQAFLATCGEHERLRWVVFEAHRRLGEHEAAIAEATKLIDAEPGDPTFWWWRGRAHEAKGDAKSAAEDKAKATSICPTCRAEWERKDGLLP